MTDVTHYHEVPTTSPTATGLVDETSTNQYRPAKKMKFDMAYVKSPEGLLKVVEIVLGLIVFICACACIRQHPVFYGCAVWAVLVGFFSMLFTAVFLVLYCLHIPSSVKKVPWKTVGTAYAAIWALFFLIAGVMLCVVAESAITRPRLNYYTGSITGGKQVMTVDGDTALPPYPEEAGYKQQWILQKSEGNHDEFRPATAGAVFAFAATLVYAADAYLSSKKRAQEAAWTKTGNKAVAV